MEQLINLVHDRFRRVKQVQQKDYESQQLRSLKDEQKQRCEKQSWVLAMVRLNKNVSLSLKNNYLTASYKIMKIIDPCFAHTAQQPNMEENFLNQFVYLYRHFFDRYEGQLNFKISVKSLLRPTNHNIINDMLKYLIDFSRDYYQQTFHWKMKVLKQKDYQRKMQFEKSNQTKESQNILLKTNGFEQRKRKTNNLSKLSMIDIDYSKKCDAFKNYDILDIGVFPTFACVEKDRSNLQYLSNKVNQVFKQNRYRNGETRLTYNNYLTMHPKGNQLNHVGNFTSDLISHPFKFTLMVQKNGYSNIEVTFDSQFRNNRQCFSRGTRYGNFQASQTFNKSDYLINSMRVLRVSQNFQPNFNSFSTLNEHPSQTLTRSENLPKISIINTERLVRYGENQEIVLVKKKPSTNHIRVLGRNERQKIVRQTQSAKEQQKIVSTNSQMIKQSKQKSNEYIPQKQFSSKVFSIRKHYPSQDKIKLRSNHKSGNQNVSELPQQKLLKWLEKMKYAKDVQRRKILGLH